jgi:hypothetical protein
LKGIRIIGFWIQEENANFKLVAVGILAQDGDAAATKTPNRWDFGLVELTTETTAIACKRFFVTSLHEHKGIKI